MPGQRHDLNKCTLQAQSLHDHLAAPLLAAPRDAFTGGLHSVAAVAAVLMAGVAVLILVMLRPCRLSARPRPTSSRLYPAGARIRRIAAASYRPYPPNHS
jgi:hypothetical protein